MHPARRLFLIAAVTTAMAADHVAAAAPVLRPANVAVAARELADRLVIRFRRIIPAMRLPTACRDDRPSSVPQLLPPHEPILYPAEFSPFQFRLPPPRA